MEKNISPIGKYFSSMVKNAFPIGKNFSSIGKNIFHMDENVFYMDKMMKRVIESRKMRPIKIFILNHSYRILMNNTLLLGYFKYLYYLFFVLVFFLKLFYWKTFPIIF